MSGIGPAASRRSGDRWTLAYEGYRPEDEGLREALCAVGNGYFVTRTASAQSSADRVHYPGTYLAGGFNRLVSDVAGRSIENEDLVNLPNWLPLTFSVDNGPEFDVDGADLLAVPAGARPPPGRSEALGGFQGRRGPRDRADRAPLREHGGQEPRGPRGDAHCA